MRKQCTRRRTQPLPPPGLRRKLSAAQLADLDLVHTSNLDAIATGQGSEAILWQVAGAALTWSRVAELLHARASMYEPATELMAQQLALAQTLTERMARTGRVIFTGAEYQTAKAGVDIMNALAAEVDQATASAAAEWSEQRLNRMASGHASARLSAAVGAPNPSPAPTTTPAP